jgi:hypothetical protein
MIVEDGVVKKINLEPEGGSGVTVTGAPTMLEQLQARPVATDASRTRGALRTVERNRD